jgi:hypothetical protein
VIRTHFIDDRPYFEAILLLRLFWGLAGLQLSISMPNKLKSKKAAKPQLPKVNKWILALVILALPFLIYFLIVRPLQVNHQRNQFKKAEVQLNYLADQIQVKIGKADQVKTEKSCAYASRTYGKGPRGCGIIVYLFYANRNAEKSTALTLGSSALLGTKLTQFGDVATGFTAANMRDGEQNINQDYGHIDSLSCGVQYTYPVKEKLNQPFKPINSENLQIALSCGGPAMTEFYPVEK